MTLRCYIVLTFHSGTKSLQVEIAQLCNGFLIATNNIMNFLKLVANVCGYYKTVTLLDEILKMEPKYEINFAATKKSLQNMKSL